MYKYYTAYIVTTDPPLARPPLATLLSCAMLGTTVVRLRFAIHPIIRLRA